MIISRTPFRVSFFGGGTDYPVWFRKHDGAILGTTIDKYCNIMVRELPPSFETKYRVVYRDEEFVDTIEDIKHPSVRECIRYTGIKKGLEVIHWSDMPSRKGMGSSSAFTVGMLNALSHFVGNALTSANLAHAASYVEQVLIKENVGNQDQVLSSIGGTLFVRFTDSGEPFACFRVSYGQLQKYLMLFDTGTSRIASHVAFRQIELTPNRTRELTLMRQMATEACQLLTNENYIGFGELLAKAWQVKRSLSELISTPEIDRIYARAVKAGAIGGKLLGAGGGGYMLFVVEPDKQNNVRSALKGLKHVTFEFESTGSQIIYKGS